MDNIINFIRHLTRSKLSEGKNLIEYSTYERIAYWWFFDTIFAIRLKTIENLANSQMRLKRFRIQIKIGKFILIYISLLINLMLKLVIKFMMYFSESKKDRKNPDVLLVSYDRQWGTVFDYFNNTYVKSDEFYFSTIRLMQKKGYKILGINNLNYFQTPNILKIMKKFSERVFQWDIPYVPLNYYWSVSIWLKQYYAYKHFTKIWNRLKHDPKLFKALEQKDPQVSCAIYYYLEYAFSFVFPLSVSYVKMAKSLIKHENPKKILIQTEYTSFGRSVTTAGKIYDKEVIAVQHGMISEDHKGYIYEPHDINYIKNPYSPYCPIPDKIAVYGDYFKDILIKKSAFKPDSIVPIGQPRYDRFFYIRDKYDWDNEKKKLGVESNEKVVLWTTQTFAIPIEENRQNINAVYNAIKSLENVKLIIKLHPNEDQNAPLYKENKTIKPIIIGKDGDTYKLIYICDLMITKTSTTGIEAILINKPLIILNLSGKPDTVNFVSEGVAIGVYNPDDLAKSIKMLLEDPDYLHKNREKFIRKYLYRADGKATERLVSILL